MTPETGGSERSPAPGRAGASYGAGASSGAGAKYVVDAHLAGAVQVGEGSTQINYNYGGGLTWTDGVAPGPLISWSGQVDSPYRGLSAFEERDAAFFFGREMAAAEILRRMSQCLHRTGLLVVSGVSGVGKSSLLHAGVLPQFRGSGLASVSGSSAWPCLVFTPTRAPLDELSVRVASMARADAAAVRHGLETNPAGFALTTRQAALTAAAGSGQAAPTAAAGSEARPTVEPRLLLVIDQFEQLFTQCADEPQREAFVQALCAATTDPGGGQPPAALAVVVVRADFEARCADYPDLAVAVQDRYLVTPMTERQLRLAITEPARTAGSMIADDLVATLLRAAGSHAPGPAATGPGSGQVARAGVLPLLSHALDQAWRRRVTDRVTLVDYERTGGIEGAVADSAQRAYGHLTSAQQAAARQVFICLTATTPEGIDVADRVSRADLIAGRSTEEARDVTTVLEEFAAARLLTLAAGTVEICHEVLLTAWPLLRDEWLAETHADRIVRTRLRSAAAEWARSSRDESYLYGGTLLAAATATSARVTADRARHPWLSQNEYEFLHASTRLEHRKARRRRNVMTVLAALSVGFGSVAAIAAVSRQEAVRQRDIEAAGQLALKSESSGTTSPMIADLEAIAAWRVKRSLRARYALLAAAARPDVAVLTGAPTHVNPVAFSPNGQVLAQVLAAAPVKVRLWNVAAHRPRPAADQPLRGDPVGGVQPGRTDARYRGRQPRRFYRHRAAVGRGRSPADRSPADQPLRASQLGGFQL